MTTPTPQAATVRIDEPGQLLASVPHMFGFPPEESLIVLGHGGDNQEDLNVCARFDLARGTKGDVLFDLLTDVLMNNSATAATLIVSSADGSDTADAPPCAQFVPMLCTDLSDMGVEILNALWVHGFRQGARWGSYVSDHGGALPDPKSTALAAEMVGVGAVVHDSRAAMRRQLEPVAKSILDRRSQLLADGVSKDDQPEISARWSIVVAALRRAARSELALSDMDVVELTVSLSDLRIFDACMAAVSTAGTREAVAAERLWLALVRETPRPERVYAGCLLGMSAYQRGDGVLAGMAFDLALAANDKHAISRTLRDLLRLGIAPEHIIEAIPPTDLPNPWRTG